MGVGIKTSCFQRCFWVRTDVTLSLLQATNSVLALKFTGHHSLCAWAWSSLLPHQQRKEGGGEEGGREVKVSHRTDVMLGKNLGISGTSSWNNTVIKPLRLSMTLWLYNVNISYILSDTCALCAELGGFPGHEALKPGMSGAILVITCCITNYPKTQWPKAMVIELS